MADRPLLVLDSASLYYRSFYALPESMTAPDGHPHNAIRGFIDTLSSLIETYSPAGVVCAWDDDWRPQWRVDLIDSYKTHRVVDGTDDVEDEPDTLGPQIGAIAAYLDEWGVCRIGRQGYEADDVIASVAAQTSGPVIAVTGDRDLFQVIDDAAQNRVLYTASGGMAKWPLMSNEQVRERFGINADQYVDFAVLRGDPSDGLPGVPGIGAVTAAALLNAHGDLDGILAATDAPVKPLTPRLVEKLLSNAKYIEHARTVVTAVADIKLGQFDARLPHDGSLRVSELAEEWGLERSTKRLHSAIAQLTST